MLRAVSDCPPPPWRPGCRRCSPACWPRRWRGSLVGPDDSMVRTVNVDPPPSAPTDEDLGLDGAHPPVDTAPQLADGSSDRRRRRRQSRPAGAGVRYVDPGPGAAGLPQRGRRAAPQRPGLPPALEPGRRRSARSSPATPTAARWTVAAAPRHRSSARSSTGRATSRRSPTPTAGSSTATPPGTARSGRCSSSRRPGRSGAATATATAAATRPTSTTPHWRPVLPVRRRPRPRRGEGPPQRRLQLQPLLGLRRPGAGLGRCLRHRHDAGSGDRRCP